MRVLRAVLQGAASLHALPTQLLHAFLQDSSTQHTLHVDVAWSAACLTADTQVPVQVRSFMELHKLLLDFELPEATRQAWDLFI